LDECPFCGQGIDDVTARFGGTCSRCFAAVPGEEAATDPGDAPVSAPSRHLRLAMVISGGVVLVVSVMILVGVGYRVARPAPAPRTVLDFDAWPMPEIVAVDDDDTPVAEARAPSAAVRPAPRRSPRGYASGAEALRPPDDLTSSLREAASARPAPSIRRRREGSGPTASVPVAAPRGADLASGVGSVDLSVGGGRVERDDNVVLDDPLAIRMMIGERLRRGISELRGCYDRRLKQRPDLAGRWRLTFTVSRDGRATDADLDGLDAADEALEGCLREHVVRRWAFARVAEPTEVSKTLSFHVGR